MAYYGCIHFNAAGSRPTYFELVGNEDPLEDNKIFKLSAAYVNAIERVGESRDMFNVFFKYQKRRPYARSSYKCGKALPSYRGGNHDVFLNTLTANVFEHSSFDPDDIRTEFIKWLRKHPINGLKFHSQKGIVTSVVSNLTSMCRKLFRMPGDPTKIDGLQFSVIAFIDTFVEVHDGYSYDLSATTDSSQTKFQKGTCPCIQPPTHIPKKQIMATAMTFKTPNLNKSNGSSDI